MFSFLSKTVTMVKEAVTSHEYLVIAGVDNEMNIQKKTSAFLGLYNSYTIIDLSPVNYNFQVHAFSIENHPVTITTNFTIGPRADDVRFLRKFAVLLADLDNQSFNVRTVREFVESNIKRWTLFFANLMTMEQILRPEFMQIVRNNIQQYLLNLYGIKVYYVDDLGDVGGHDQQGEQVHAMNEDVKPYDEFEIDYYDV